MWRGFAIGLCLHVLLGILMLAVHCYAEWFLPRRLENSFLFILPVMYAGAWQLMYEVPAFFIARKYDAAMANGIALAAGITVLANAGWWIRWKLSN